jgi:D-sedoheptulose 7-phosphate isomerase
MINEGIIVAEGTMVAYRDECIAALNSVDLYAVESVSNALLQARDQGSRIFVVGNGGSAATASHMATDLMLGSGLVDPPLRVVALTDNQALITATGNDISFDQVFSRQLIHLAERGDILMAVSASGNSPNVLACVDAAKKLGLTTIAFTGFDGGQLAALADLLVHVPTRMGAYGPVEDVHLVVNHMITEQLKGAK